MAPDRFRLGLHPAHGAEHRHHAIKDPHRALHLNGEVDVARGVDDVDAVVFPTGGNGSRRDRDAPFSFLLHPVGDGGAVVHLTHLVNHARIEKNPFGGGGFARVNVGGDPDISDAVEGVGAGH